MSKLRTKLAEINKFAEEAATLEAPVEEGQGQEGTEQSDQDFLSAIQALGFTLNNPEKALRGQQWGKLGALDLLNTDGFFNQLMGINDKNQAVNFIFETISKLDGALGEFPQYNKLGEATKNKLKVALQKNRDVASMAMTISNFGLKGSGNGVVAEIESEGLLKSASHVTIAELASDPVKAKQIIKALIELL